MGVHIAFIAQSLIGGFIFMLQKKHISLSVFLFFYFQRSLIINQVLRPN